MFSCNDSGVLQKNENCNELFACLLAVVQVFFLKDDQVAPTLLGLIDEAVLEQKFGGQNENGADIFAFPENGV